MQERSIDGKRFIKEEDYYYFLIIYKRHGFWVYVNILEEKWLEINYQESIKFNWILQFDNDPKHKNKLEMELIKKKKIETLDWLLTLQICHQ